MDLLFAEEIECGDFLFGLNTFEYLHTNDSTDTAIVFAKNMRASVDAIDVAIKIRECSKNINSFDVERILYRTYFSFMIDNLFTPHLVKYVTSFECNLEWLHANGFVDRLGLRETFGNGVAGNVDNNLRFSFLVTEKTQNKSLARFMFKHATDDAMRSILFQIIFTLKVFAVLGLRHNDLHYNNIFIENFQHSSSIHPFTCYCYSTMTNDQLLFQVPTKHYFAKIFDLDLAFIDCSSPSISNDHKHLQQFARKCGINVNSALDTEQPESDMILSRDRGKCNQASDKFDVAFFLANVYSLMKKSGVNCATQDFIKRVIRQTDILKRWNGGQPSLCETSISSFDEMMKDQYFAEFQVKTIPTQLTCYKIPSKNFIRKT